MGTYVPIAFRVNRKEGDRDSMPEKNWGIGAPFRSTGNLNVARSSATSTTLNTGAVLIAEGKSYRNRGRKKGELNSRNKRQDVVENTTRKNGGFFFRHDVDEK